jgi:integrase
VARRSFGSVRRLPSGRWQVRYVGPDGQRRTSAETFATKGDASRWLARTETEISRGQWIDPAAAAGTLRTYAAAWIAQRTVRGKPLAPRTLQTYRHSLDAHILPTLGELRLTAITPAVVRTWHASVMAAGPTAARQAYATLRAILNTAVADEALHRNPCRIPGAGQPSSPERPLLDVSTVEALAAAMPRHLQVLTLVAFWGHLRIGEVVALQRRDVDLRTGTIHVRRQHVEKVGKRPLETLPKAASTRSVHLPVQAVEALEGHLVMTSGLPNAPVFIRRDGSQLRASHVQRAWSTARQKVGRPDVHFHDLRHAGLTLTAQLGATQAEIMRRAGHSSTRAAAIYQHAAESRDLEIAQRLSDLRRQGR